MTPSSPRYWIKVRYGSPAPGGSILITRAPKSDKMVAAAGPATKLPQSMTRRSLNSPDAIVRLLKEPRRARACTRGPWRVTLAEMASCLLHLGHRVLRSFEERVGISL